MEPLETSLTIVGLALAGVAILFLIVVALLQLLNRGGDAELRAIRKEREENERSSDKAAMKAVEQLASASSLGREVRHTRRQLTAEASRDRHQRALDALTGGLPGGGGAGGPPPPPPHP